MAMPAVFESAARGGEFPQGITGPANRAMPSASAMLFPPGAPLPGCCWLSQHRGLAVFAAQPRERCRRGGFQRIHYGTGLRLGGVAGFT
jgi:hypothetical protein